MNIGVIGAGSMGENLPRAVFANVPSRVAIIDIGNYHPELRDGRIDAIDRGMLAPALRRALADADRRRIADYRAEREAQIRASLAAKTHAG